uniref:Putative reverse transcriptase domain-containing protein n=1 Tax=Tanacetum cinerariifolium TaxID=118510 RepID=A0A699S9X4_TANCI|nr:putative reverse transcriptase domain-containing protein [Tanacetum cinerariifolium]
MESIRNATGFEYCLSSPYRWPDIVWKEVSNAHSLGRSRRKQANWIGDCPGVSYAKNRRKPLEFSVGDKVLLKVSPRKGVVRFGIHDTFYASNLKKCLAVVNLQVPLEEIKIDNKLHFVEEPMEIIDCEVKKLKKSRIPIVKVCWNSRRGPEFTWEREDEMKCKYP